MILVDEDKLYAELKGRSDMSLRWYKEGMYEDLKERAKHAVITFCKAKKKRGATKNEHI
jgi:hypothetical protein